MKDPGYWIQNQVFSDSECEYILETLSRNTVRRSRAGARNLMSFTAIREFAEDERLLRIGEEILGRRLVPFKATLFEKTGKANWLVAFHQDTALPLQTAFDGEGWGPKSKKQGTTFVHAPTSALSQILAIRIQLDASTSFNGPLRVIPNSHHERLATDAQFDSVVNLENEVVCTTERGGIIAMSPLLLHASSKALTDDPRRVLHVEYAISLDIAPGIRLAIS